VLQSPLILLATTASHTPPPSQPTGGNSVWKLIVAFGVVGSLIAGGQQIIASARRRRFRAAEQRVLEATAANIDAEAARHDADEARALRAELRKQVEEDVPREARRVFLLSRRDALSTQIAQDVEEYQALEAELARLEGRRSTPLDERLRAVVEASIVPTYVGRRRTDRVVVTALIVLLVLSVISFKTTAISGLWTSYDGALLYPATSGVFDLTSSLIAGAAIAGIAVFWLQYRWQARLRTLRIVDSGRATRIALAAAVGFACVLAAGILQAHESTVALAKANRTFAAAANASGAENSRLYAQYVHQFATFKEIQHVSTILMWIGHIGFGAAVGSCLAFLAMFRRQGPWKGLGAANTAENGDDAALAHGAATARRLQISSLPVCRWPARARVISRHRPAQSAGFSARTA
jgi:hypothetical protein